MTLSMDVCGAVCCWPLPYTTGNGATGAACGGIGGMAGANGAAKGKAIRRAPFVTPRKGSKASRLQRE
jgi:hypothetical protein